MYWKTPFERPKLRKFERIIMTSLWPTYLLGTLPNLFILQEWWQLHENYMNIFFYSIVMFNYDYMFPVAFKCTKLPKYTPRL